VPRAAVLYDPFSDFAFSVGPSYNPATVFISDAPNPDTVDDDADGLADQVEAMIGTDPHDPDTDSNGLDDGVETMDDRQ